MKLGIQTNFDMENSMVISIFEHFQTFITFVTSQRSSGPKLVQNICLNAKFELFIPIVWRDIRNLPKFGAFWAGEICDVTEQAKY